MRSADSDDDDDAADDDDDETNDDYDDDGKDDDYNDVDKSFCSENPFKTNCNLLYIKIIKYACTEVKQIPCSMESCDENFKS